MYKDTLLIVKDSNFMVSSKTLNPAPILEKKKGI